MSMIQALAAGWRGPRGRQRLTALAISVLFHAALLTVIGLGLNQTRLGLRDAEPPTVFLELEPYPTWSGEASRRSARISPRIEETSLAPATRRTSRLIEEEERPSPPVLRLPNPRLAAPSPQGPATTAGGPGVGDAGAVPDPWRYRPGDQRNAMARSLRLGAAGCRTMDGHLSPNEQRYCDERFNAAAAEAARRHPPGARTLTPSETRREAQFAQEGAAALARYERRRAPLRSGAGVSGISPECVGGNLRGTCPGAHLRPEYQHQEEAPFGGTAKPK